MRRTVCQTVMACGLVCFVRFGFISTCKTWKICSNIRLASVVDPLYQRMKIEME